MIGEKLKNFFLLLDSFQKKLKVAFRFQKKSWPTLSQWRQIFKVLGKKEKITFFGFAFLTLVSALFLALNFYFKNTVLQPAEGKSYIEGLVGQPRLLNPIYAPSDDVDRDLVELLFSGLMKYNLNGETVPDLAKDYQIEEDGKIYKINLKENLFWSDGKPITAEDVIFTVKIIQNPDYQSLLRPDFLGIEVEKISENSVYFKLRKPYLPFLETLTFKILPKHIWQDIPPQSFPLAIYNLQPVSNGPFQLKKINQNELGYIKSLTLSQNPYFHSKKPFLAEISFYFFENEEDLIKAALKKEIKGFSISLPENLENLKDNFKIYHLSFPRYFEVSFNPEKSKVLAEVEVRKALNYGTDKKEILREVLSDQGKIVNSPFLPEIFNLEEPKEKIVFDLEKAKEILEVSGWQDLDQDSKREKIIKEEIEDLFTRDLKKGSQGEDVRNLQACLAKDPQVYPEGEINGYFGEKTKEAVIRFQEKYSEDILKPWGFRSGTGIVSKTTREKLNEICFGPPEEVLPLKFTLVTVDQKEMVKVAELLKKQWERLGVDLEIKKANLFSLQQDFLKPRNYESLLFGKIMGLIPDPYSFWHSLQKRDPGLNLAIYENKEVDKFLEKARETFDEKERREIFSLAQEIILADYPALFLYSPDYLYFLSKEIKGMKEGIIADPSKRFIDVENWYRKTKRVWK